MATEKNKPAKEGDTRREDTRPVNDPNQKPGQRPDNKPEQGRPGPGSIA